MAAEKAAIHPGLAAALEQHCGPEWRTNREVLKALTAFYGDTMTNLTSSDMSTAVMTAIGKDVGATFNAAQNLLGDLGPETQE
jgi:hypothetical protein